jgi:hypothetical protein
MKYALMLLAVWMGISGSPSARAQAEWPERLPVLVPESAGHSPQEWGLSHTHLRVLVAADAAKATVAQFNTPSTIRSAYNLPSTGGAGAIAIVDAYHYPTALADFNAFAQQFQLPGFRGGLCDGQEAVVGGQLYRELESRGGFGHRMGPRDGAERQDLSGGSSE